MPTITECLDLPPCHWCGGHARWLNTGDAPGGLYRMHCATCSPPPGADAPQVGDASDAEEG